MSPETLKKLQQLAAAQKQKNVTPKFSGKNGTEKNSQQATPQATTPVNLTPTPAPQPKPKPKTNAEKSPLKSFTIEWHEGTGEFDGITVNTWTEATRMLNQIHKDHGNSIGYSKTKIVVEWQNGKKIVDRIDVGNNGSDYNPEKYFTIGHYLQGLKSVMYKSNFQQGERELCQFEDTPEIARQADKRLSEEEAKKQPKISVILPEDNKPPVIITPAQIEANEATAPEISSFTFADLMSGNLPEEKQPDTTPAPAAMPAAAATVYTAPKPPATPPADNAQMQPLEIVHYSKKCIVLFGTRTKELKDEIKNLGGKFATGLNYKGTRQCGWLFYPDQEQDVRDFIEFFS